MFITYSFVINLYPLQAKQEWDELNLTAASELAALHSCFSFNFTSASRLLRPVDASWHTHGPRPSVMSPCSHGDAKQGWEGPAALAAESGLWPRYGSWNRSLDPPGVVLPPPRPRPRGSFLSALTQMGAEPFKFVDTPIAGRWSGCGMMLLLASRPRGFVNVTASDGWR